MFQGEVDRSDVSVILAWPSCILGVVIMCVSVGVCCAYEVFRSVL
jgi:hypothetical protein